MFAVNVSGFDVGNPLYFNASSCPKNKTATNGGDVHLGNFVRNFANFKLKIDIFSSQFSKILFHFMTFGGHAFTYNGAGDHIYAQTDQIDIQTRSIRMVDSLTSLL